MNQETDIHGVADYLKTSVATIRNRRKAGSFPEPDTVENGIEWWSIDTLDRYRRNLARRKNRLRKKRMK